MPEQDEREYLIIEDGLVRQVLEKHVKVTTEAEFRRAALAQKRVDSPVLPFGTILYGVHQAMQYVFLWRPERLGFFQHRDQREESPKHLNITLELAWPCHVLVLAFQRSSLVKSQLWFANKPIHTTDQELFLPPLPNQRADDMCLGSEVKKALHKESVVISSENLIKYVYESRFNNDLSSHVEGACPAEFGKLPKEGPGLKSVARRVLSAWHDWTQKNKEKDWRKAINEIKWPGLKRRVAEIREGLL